MRTIFTLYNFGDFQIYRTTEILLCFNIGEVIVDVDYVSILLSCNPSRVVTQANGVTFTSQFKLIILLESIFFIFDTFFSLVTPALFYRIRN